MASWALDGVSMLTSGKSVTDHGISILAKKDCAIWRGVKGDDICREGEDILTAFAEAILTPAEAPVEVGELAAFEVAAGAVDNTEDVIETPAVSLFAADREVAVAAPEPTQQAPTVKTPPSTEDNIYYVIGSFTGPARAERLVADYARLDGKVMRGNSTNGKEIFRSVIGPFRSDERADAQRQIIKAGINDAWETRVDHRRWTVYQPIETAMNMGVYNYISGFD
ncbi:MAG: hypothetical protein A3G18_01660 [Rhodospirillales bacterium RIFCSPLOWO2_12_FULL_58_28]|nr:MAG: hypothetical protein A3G18_01660 [Rhodospirillales bacterium RIFCSPLOWO2_12_FULL_58_28]